MRAGRLDRRISIQREAETVNDYGTVERAWTSVAADIPAERVQQTTGEFLKGYGEDAETAIVFRIRHRAGLAMTDRVVFEGRAFDLVELKEIGRRVGLELRCEASK